ncbi:AMP-dependent synthetase [Planomonospora sphaerica]|uniref:AMP-dependent synthetase n=1 Tax=Planomonospora sphaerica TaxID=161355 RepID=A0A171CRK5_9ACTN|nr:non-ribosomal peptide synthetase [Planomonospora sphaerica]GAT67109.1 AMP-dependent synthetase [Planomonospora sphaerica]
MVCHTRSVRGRRAVTSCAQDGLWLLSGLDPEPTAHSLCRAYRISGDLDVGALRAAWREVVSRHEPLRTVVRECGGRLVQHVSPWSEEAGHALALLGPDAGGGPGTGGGPDAERRAERVRAALAAEPFDLARGPLARATLVRLGEADHLLTLAFHRVVADDRSVSIVVDELSAGYAAALAGLPAGAALPALPSRFADHARRQRRWIRTPAFRELLDWWTRTLTPLPPPAALPVDRGRPGAPRGGAVRFDWGTEAAAQVAELARAAGTAPSTVLLAALHCLLHRYGGADRTAVTVPASLRTAPETDLLVGPFVNPLVLTADLSGGPGFRELLTALDGRVRESLARRELPFPHLVRALGAGRDPHRVPLCDVVLDVRETPESELRLPGAEVRRLPGGDGAAAADLAFTVDLAGPSVTGSLACRGGLLDRDSARSLLDQLRTLLAAAAEDPALPVDALPLEPADRVRAAVREADRTGGPPSPGPGVHELVRRHAVHRPHAGAVDWGGDVTPYRELTRWAAALSARLRDAGCAEGAAVAVRMPPGPGRIAALLGVLSAGAHLVWLGTGDAGDRVKAVLSDLRPACMLVEDPAGGDGLAEWYRGELGGRVLDGAAGAGNAPVEAPSFPGAPGPDAWAYVAYTSGSTGRPKGIPQTHAALAQFVTWFAAEFGIGPGSRVAQWVAPEHDPALCEVFAALVSGATLCPVPDGVRAHPEKLAAWLADQGITHLQTVPSFAGTLLGAIAGGGAAERFAALRHVLLMGEAVPPELVRGLRAALPAARLVNLYGPTETIAATWQEIGDETGAVPIGRPIPGRQVLVVDGRDRPCPAGVTGEIVVRSPYVTPGYVGASAGAAAFRPLRGIEEPAAAGRTYRTGDLARRRRDGRLEFRGRKDFQVKLSGIRIELTEVEAALSAHESVAECAVVARTGRDGLPDVLVAYVVPVPAASGDASPVRAWRACLRRRFGRETPPVLFTVLDRPLPRNLTGKVDRGRLPAHRRAAARRPAAPTPTEEDVIALWSELLGTAGIGAGDDFFAAGGHSLLVLRLAARVRDRFGVELPLRRFFAEPTPARLAALIDEAARPPAAGVAVPALALSGPRDDPH